MCGIAGVVGVPGDQRGLAERLLGALRHRGPDDEGIEHVAPAVTLVHSRLAIIDPTSAGHEPMRDERGNWIVYNGEVFNYREINARLAEHGTSARTRSDTETILRAHVTWGDDAVQHFRGMFAYALFERASNRVLITRDRLGIKPMYLSRPAAGGLVFASQLRALLALGSEIVARRVNRSAIESFLAQGAVQGDESIVDGIVQLAPGSQLSLDAETGRELRLRRYWQLARTDFDGSSRAEFVDRLSRVAREAVGLRLRSDVPMGLFLSGGVDSTAMLALASEHQSSGLRTLTVGFDDPDFDETAIARRTAARFGAEHETLTLTASDVLGSVPALLDAVDQPTVDGANIFFVSRAARASGLTVALSGLGADELFGGYASFSDVPRAVAWRRRIPGRALANVARYAAVGRAGAKVVEAMRRDAEPLQMYLLRRELFLPDERRALHTLPSEVDAVTGLRHEQLALVRHRAATLDPIAATSLFELELYMGSMLLRDGDAFSMAAPIEYRVPFLDHELVETAFAAPSAWKRRDPRPKPLLLDAVGARMPAETWQAPKRGFTFPWQSWLGAGGALNTLARDAVHDTAVWRDLAIDSRGIADLWQRFSRNQRRVGALQILGVVVLRDYAARHGLTA